ncbi:MAG: aminopeptidase P N-terminal domain-containing protein [Candidatus Aminicenantes bacterium]|nr:aminopeptidase P N-terminal domain-containing protein [Candidatus Aminicenantes bacterium]MDH5384656.1 aminopeptidase P N-terminal domain-containing protein [Candidatus Aminicenantes bacterium]
MTKRFRMCLLAVLGILLVGSTGFAGVFTKEEYAARRARLMKKIPDGVAIVLGAKPKVGYYAYYQNNDFVYFTGVEIPDAVLIIDGMSHESALFFTISERGARSEGISLDYIQKPKEITGIEKIYPREEFTTYLNQLADGSRIFYTSLKPEELMRECTNEKLRTLQRYMVSDDWDGRPTREQQFVKLLEERSPQVEIRDCSQMIWDLRIIKSPAEIDVLRKAARIAVKAHIEMIKATRPGMFEYELASLYEYLVKKDGAQNLAYYAIICSGENHPYLHYHKYDRLLQDGDFLVIDVGPDLGYYDIDITVSYPVNGKFTPRQKEIYEACNAVHESCLQVYRPGLTLKECQQEVQEILKEQGYDLSKDYFKWMRGGFGHYVGMAVHDVGRSPMVLQPGMVFANEPLCVFPEENLGVRVEDTILITEDGCENLTAGIPRTVKDIEALMKKPGIIQVLKKAGLY